MDITVPYGIITIPPGSYLAYGTRVNELDDIGANVRRVLVWFETGLDNLKIVQRFPLEQKEKQVPGWFGPRRLMLCTFLLVANGEFTVSTYRLRFGIPWLRRWEATEYAARVAPGLPAASPLMLARVRRPSDRRPELAAPRGQLDEVTKVRVLQGLAEHNLRMRRTMELMEGARHSKAYKKIQEQLRKRGERQ